MANPLLSIKTLIDHYQSIQNYQVTIRSTHLNGVDEIRYFYQKPGFVRMEFIEPHAGVVLIYNPKSDEVRVWPFGAGRFPWFDLKPENPLILSPQGQRIDRSDVGSLFVNLATLESNGRTQSLGEELIDGVLTQHLAIIGQESFVLGQVHRFDVWVDVMYQFPVKIVSTNLQGTIIETVLMTSLGINEPFPNSLFNP
jgi:hypothetical protein